MIYTNHANNDNMLQIFCKWLNANCPGAGCVITQITRYRFLIRDTLVHYAGGKVTSFVDYFSMFLTIIILVMTLNLILFNFKSKMYKSYSNSINKDMNYININKTETKEIFYLKTKLQEWNLFNFQNGTSKNRVTSLTELWFQTSRTG
jgi:hypothetical protein